jgi:hypothetical protein
MYKVYKNIYYKTNNKQIIHHIHFENLKFNEILSILILKIL